MCFETTGFASRFDSIFCCIPHAIINGKKCYFIEEENKNCKLCLQQKRRELKATKRKLGGRAVKTEEINKTKGYVRKEDFWSRTSRREGHAYVCNKCGHCL